MNFRTLVTLLGLTILFAAAPCLAKDGGSNGGGGDPDAYQFVQIGRTIQQRQAKSPIPGFNVSADDLGKRLDEIYASLEGKNPLVILPAGETVDCYGFPKMGCYIPPLIVIARDAWEKPHAGPRFDVTAMELMKSLGFTDRYAKGDVVARELAPCFHVGLDGIIVQILPLDATPQQKQCSDVRYTLADLLNDYASAVTGCKKYSSGTDDYLRSQITARSVESTYPSAVQLCHQFCDVEGGPSCDFPLPKNVCP